jgi:hypothetical protein
MTTATARQASDRLTIALLTIATQGLRVHCSDPVTHHYWTSEHEAERRLAQLACRDCPVGREVARRPMPTTRGGVSGTVSIVRSGSARSYSVTVRQRDHQQRSRQMTTRGKPRANTTARGYGNLHQQLRKQIAKQVAAGTAVCWRCGQPILPWMLWDLGHDDYDRSIYRGPEHQRCNRSAAAVPQQPDTRHTQQDHQDQPGRAPLVVRAVPRTPSAF